MLKRIRKHLPVAAGLLAIIAVYGLVGGQDMQDEQDSTAQVRYIIDLAREEALQRNIDQRFTDGQKLAKADK